jgi:hypothetical protein
MTDTYPVGTVAARGRDLGPFQGTPRQFPPGWIIPDGATLRPDQHDHPRLRGRPWKLPNMLNQIITGNSTHFESRSDHEGNIGHFQAANPDMPGEYPLIKVRNG